ncbi:unnamed protein product [Anisakis simplex]|uniref:Protein kinase domain-containing protein n=1 Tax=Anisakis simplex TaxID=6269 RepID=A0A0M3JMM0_ANISI|nr:unnamed protein product [Anisakis simplex]
MILSSLQTSTHRDNACMSRKKDNEPPVNNYPIIAEDKIKIVELLGAGGYGAVFRAQWTTEKKVMWVAVKKVGEVEKEAYLLSRIRHRNIVEFYGISKTDLDFLIVTG